MTFLFWIRFFAGVMSGSIPWQVLESQYLSYGHKYIEEVGQLIHSPEKNVLSQ